MAIRLICLDLDGTLLGPDKRVSAACRAALAEARAAGLAVAIASGRHPFSIADLCDDLGLPHTAVCLSGALVLVDGREVFRHPISAAGVATAIDAAEACGCYISLSGADFNLYTGVPDWMRRKLAAGDTGTAAGAGSVGSVPAAARYGAYATYDDLRAAAAERGDAVLKAAINASDDASYARLRGLLAEARGVKVAQSDTRWMDVNAAGCSKAEGIEELAAALGLGLAEVAAVGDDENDVESIAAVGLGIAMGNAIGSVREAAKIDVADNAHDGCADAIRLAIQRMGCPFWDVP